ncbi:MAG: hypothetical protein LBT82_03250 [Oscillospiraceae bacterium]|jgi:uncharacterized membrane protein YdbT with pleckstrin-like domain|nr:hypothetical protein [Oscillospiraceae bacterium]
MKKAENYFKVSRYTIFEYLYRFAFVLILPVTQQILSCILDPSKIISAITTNTFLVFILVNWAYLECKSKKYSVKDSKLFFTKGFLINHECSVDFCKLQSVLIRKNFLTLVFSANKLFFETSSSNKSKPDISLTLNKKKSESLVFEVIPLSQIKKTYKVKISRVLLMSLTWSNPLTGLLLLSPFFERIGKMMGNKLRDKFYSTIDSNLDFALLGVSPLITAIIRILIVGWFVAFFVHMFKFINFKSNWMKNVVFINKGILVNLQIAICLNNVNVIMLRQTLIMKFLKIYNVYVDVNSCKKNKKDQNLVLLYSRKEEIEKVLEDFFIFPAHNNEKIKMSPETRNGFILAPSIIFVTSIIIFIFVILNKHKNIYLAFSIFYIMFSIWWLCLKILAFKISGVSLEQKNIVISSYNYFSIYSSVISIDKVQLFKIYQSLPQKKSKLCSVEFFLFSKNKKRFKVDNLQLSKVEKLLSIIKEF